jgi:hypothetical protein
MGRTSRVIDRRRIMVGVVRRIRGMVGGRLEMVVGLDRLGTATAAGIGREMETEAGLAHRVMAVGLDRLGTAGILGMEAGLVPLGTGMEAGLDRLEMAVELLGMVEAAGLLLLLVPRRRLDLRLRRGQLQPLLIGQLQPLLIGQLLDLLQEDLTLGILRVGRSRRNGLSRRLVRGQVDLVGITMARRRGRLVIVAKPALAAVDVREVNRNEIVQA